MNLAEWGIAGLFVLSFVTPAAARRGTNRSSSKKRRTSGKINRSTTMRSDDDILQTPVDDLTPKEFERLWALYFREKGYDVEEPGQKGKDGGVDLVLTDRRSKERTAVQIKHWKQKNVGPDVIRELHSARWNTTPRCDYGLLVTSADVTKAAREEAHARTAISFWHGGMIEVRLSKWNKWRGSAKSKV